MVGLLIELIGIWAVFKERGNDEATRITLPGGGSAPLAWLIVGLGFVVWLAGTVLVSLPKPRTPTRRTIDDDVLWSGRIGEDLATPKSVVEEVQEPRPIDEVQS
jgi:hypothetical protein